MKLFEYQAKDAFSKNGITIPNGVVINSMDEFASASASVGFPCVVKSQVLRGGRGKAGLIRFSKTSDEAGKNCDELFKSEHNVRTILLEQAVNIERELYLSITIDPVDSKAIVIASAEGGVDIEELAVNSPDKIIMEKVDINVGLMSYQIKNIVFRMGLDGDIAKQVEAVILKLYNVFRKFDAELAEINPLFVTKEGKVIAGDGKLSIDDNSMFRQTGYEVTRAYFDSDAEFEASKEGIPYLQFDGRIAMMCAGAGLTTTVYDLINYEGGDVACYLEFGGPNYKKAVQAMELCLKNTNSKVILIVTFGTIARADVMAEGIVDAINKLKPSVPIVTCIRGTNEEKAVEILRSAGLEPLFDTEEAVRKAVEISKGRI